MYIYSNLPELFPPDLVGSYPGGNYRSPPPCGAEVGGCVHTCRGEGILISFSFYYMFTRVRNYIFLGKIIIEYTY